MALAHSDAVGVSVPSEGQSTSVAAVLNAAADLIEKPGAWTQGALYRRKASGAVCYCTLGAIIEAANGRHSAADPAIDAFQAASEVEYVADWNDAPERTQAEVVAALREAARKADAAPGSDITGGDEGRQAEVNPSQAGEGGDA